MSAGADSATARLTTAGQLEQNRDKTVLGNKQRQNAVTIQNSLTRSMVVGMEAPQTELLKACPVPAKRTVYNRC